MQTPGPYKVTRALAGPYTKGRYAPLGETPLIVDDDDIEVVDIDIDALTLTAHGLQTGDGPIQFTTTDTLPAGLLETTDYWIVRRDDDQIKLASSLENTLA